MKTVAFIGLGNMGSGMAKNLVSNWYTVVAYDVSTVALEKAELEGCQIARSASDAVKNADVVVTMLPSGAHVAEVYHNQVLPNAKANAILIDCSTIDVTTAKEVAVKASKRGFSMLDGPVSGGTKAADAGTLTFMVGGVKDTFDEVLKIFEAMGQKVVYAGSAGAGQAAKICNNMLLGSTMVATCETFVLAQKLGLDLQTFYDISSAASGQTWSMTSYCPVKGVGPLSPADNDYMGGFAVALMLKDLNLANDSAVSVDAEIPMGGKALALFSEYCNDANRQLDFSSIIKQFQG